MDREFVKIMGAFVAGAVVTTVWSYMDGKLIPPINNVQSGYATPSKLEMRLEDSNKDGKYEFVISYGEKDFYLMLDEQGNLKIETYNPRLKK